MVDTLIKLEYYIRERSDWREKDYDEASADRYKCDTRRHSEKNGNTSADLFENRKTTRAGYNRARNRFLQNRWRKF